jgi:D-proline reductase (dithiol) PrdB
MTVEYMQGIAERYQRLGYPIYRWFHADAAPPWTPLAKPLAQSRIGLLSTSGAYALGQVAYRYKDDASIREIPAGTPDADMRFSHLTENYLADARRDSQCMVPTGALRRLVSEGLIGALAEKVFSCMGAVYSQRRVREELAPALLAAFRSQKVDAALLVAL